LDFGLSKRSVEYFAWSKKMKHALVIGGSIGGLLTANLLRTIGWEVTVFERTRGDLAGRGAGLGVHEELFSVLRKIGIRTEESMGVVMKSRIALERDGNVLCEVPLRGMTSAWDRIYRALINALPAACLRSGMQLERFEQDVSGVSAFFADGSSAVGDLLIGADGIRSTVRQQLLPEVEPKYAGYVNWRGVVAQSEIPIAMHDLVFNHLAFSFAPDNLAISMPIAPEDDTRAYVRRCQFVWCQPVEFEIELPKICTDASGHCHGISIPSPMIRPVLISELNEQARAQLAPQIAELIARTAQPILSPIFDLESPQMSFGRIVLLGDAAFVARPHVGMGVTKAALDAQSLIDALAVTNGDVKAALAGYEKKQLQFGKQVVARGRHLGSYLEAHRRPAGSLSTILSEWGADGLINGEPISVAFAA
jgi:2-polyprenyl-6-methoxyphenol hydroxylase-like FAD-dependent oxidoreductase